MAEVQEGERIARLKERMTAVERSLDRLESRLDNVEVGIKELCEEIHGLDIKIAYLGSKMTIMFLILAFLIVFLNQDALIFILKLLRILPT